MGINPTPTNFKTFTFDGENSRAYGVYITGEGVFNAPERNVEMVDIPGRNGAFALDKGNFNNIEVTYPAGIFADTEADFAQAVSDLRNLLCSKVGYVRLEDDYNPNEYRLAIYKSGLDVDHDFLIAGEFELVFECKPQRYLKSGETPISVTSGDTITNPTRFDAQPLLQVWGYGNISINGNSLSVFDVPYGMLEVSQSINAMEYGTSTPTMTTTIEIDDTLLQTGDDIYINNLVYSVYLRSFSAVSAVTQSVVPNSGTHMKKTSLISAVSLSPKDEFYIADHTFAYGTAETFSSGVQISTTFTMGSSQTETQTYAFSTVYDGTTKFTFTISVTLTENRPFYIYGKWINAPATNANSTRLTTGNPLYVDLETGIAWNEDFGEPVSSNMSVSLGTLFPTLGIGANTITYDNTVTQLDIVPRWWQV